MQNSILNGILFGLDLKDDQLAPQKHLFPCCGGSGEREDPESNSLLRCRLQRRLKATQELIDLANHRWGPQAQRCLVSGASTNARILRQVSDTLKGYRPQGSLAAGKQGRPSEFWLMALACSWRFGINTHVVTFGHSSFQNLLPTPIEPDVPVALFVEQVNKLWDPREAEKLEALIYYAYHSNAFLWIEFCQQTSSEQRAGASVHEKISHKISNLKNRSPYDFLAKNCLSRLRSMCQIPLNHAEGVLE